MCLVVNYLTTWFEKVDFRWKKPASFSSKSYQLYYFVIVIVFGEYWFFAPIKCYYAINVKYCVSTKEELYLSILFLKSIFLLFLNLYVTDGQSLSINIYLYPPITMASNYSVHVDILHFDLYITHNFIFYM